MASDRHLARLLDGAAAWNRWRSEEPLVRPDLQGLSLTLAQKQWGQTSGGPINLSQSLLREADLRHATLIDADLSGATLAGADLSGARMRNANLRNANLSQVRFDGADLEGAQFAGANLSGADLGSARNLSASQIEAALGDAKTLLPQQLVAASGWRDGAVAEPHTPVAAEPMKVTAQAYFPSVLRAPKPEGDPFANRFGRALSGLPRPRLDTVASQARRTLNDLPRPRLDAVTDRAKAALQSLPRPRIGAVAERARAALQSVPRPRLRAVTDRARSAIGNVPRPNPAHVAKRVGAALSGLPHPKVIAIAGVAGIVLVFGFGAMLALRGFESRSVDAATRTGLPPAIVAEAPATTLANVPEEPSTEEALKTEPPAPTAAAAPLAAPLKAAPTERLAVTESEQTAPVEEVRQDAGDGAAAAPVEERPRAVLTETVPVVPAVPEDLPSNGPDRSSDSQVRLAFATRAEDVSGVPDKPINAPIVGGAAQAFIESYVGQPAATRALNDTMERTDLPTPKSLAKPTTLAKAPAPEAMPEALNAPTSVVDYISLPNKSSDWIKVFIKNFYLSGEALSEADLRHIYSKEVNYFGKRTSIDKVARETARYYRDWPKRHYELVPGSIDIKWKSAQVADVSFIYDYKVSAPKKKKATKGRGRAHLTFDLRGQTGLIVREDGEVIANH